MLIKLAGSLPEDLQALLLDVPRATRFSSTGRSRP
jgi:hypothetical protein